MKLDPNKWYFKTSVLIVAFLCVGPFMLPLVWINPRYKMAKKIVITAIIVVLSYALGLVLYKSLENISSYYNLITNLSKGG